ncbi:MAG: hypothetical protein HY600_00710, partial [Candidatus Omnitrophica bacterium]|nr:hypothetical protein [Candidatus Omnitrophota bacterium]
MTRAKKSRGRPKPKRPLRWWIMVAIGGAAWCVIGGLFLCFLASPVVTTVRPFSPTAIPTPSVPAPRPSPQGA